VGCILLARFETMPLFHGHFEFYSNPRSGGFWLAISLRGCLYESEPARVPELARIPEMNFTTRLHETYMKGWLFLF
jgi:hypothetical protein